MRGRILLVGSQLAAIVVAVLTTVALLLVEPKGAVALTECGVASLRGL
jgi:hypothetical protein